MIPNETIKFLNETIDTLIFSNMQKGNPPFDLTLNFGVYQLVFQGEANHSLKDAVNWFKTEIAIIKSGVKR